MSLDDCFMNVDGNRDIFETLRYKPRYYMAKQVSCPGIPDYSNYIQSGGE